MKYFFILLFLTVNLLSSTQLDALGHKNDIEYNSLITKYFKTSLALQIDVRKIHLRPYYKYAKYDLIWFQDGKIDPFLQEIIERIEKDEIISPKVKNDFNFDTIEELLQKKLVEQSLDIKDTVRLDMLLTYMFDRYIYYVAKGSIDWKLFEEKTDEIFKEEEIIINWARSRAYFKKVKLLEQLLQEKNIALIDDIVDISYPEAKELQGQLQQLKELAQSGGYITIPKTKTLRPKQSSDIVPLLRQRLVQSNDYALEEYENVMNIEIVSDQNSGDDKQQINIQNRYDEYLVQAVKSFQKNHGLEVDGIVGKDTIKHLNITVEQKIKTIKLNLERMRWLKRDFGKKFLLVNIPDYKLKYYENKEVKLELPVVVGTPKHPTPVFSHRLSSVVLNPYWRLPERIVQREIIPKLIENPEYLVQNNINIHENWNHESQVFDPSMVEWKYFLPSEDQQENNEYPDIPFKFIQIPGENNPLGKMKFMFRNQFSVYLHDTSDKALFTKRKRSFSHGCIRVQTPHKLLQTISKIDDQLKYDEALEILSDLEKTEIDLEKTIPIHIVYLTAFVDENGVLQFRDDIYGFDKIQQQIMYEDIPKN